MDNENDFSEVEQFLLQERMANAGQITADAGRVFTFLIDQLVEINERGVKNERELQIYDTYLVAAQRLWWLFEPLIPEDKYKQWGRDILMPLYLDKGRHSESVRKSGNQ